LAILDLVCLALVGAARAEEYESILPLLRDNCLACHAGAGAQAGLDLSTLATALKGGKSGPAFKPGAAAESLLVVKVESGQMPPGRRLAPAQVASLRGYIDKLQPVRAPVTEADAVPIFQMRCVTCHGKRKQEGGLDLRSQESRLRGGKSGPAIVCGKPDESLVLKRIGAGEMPPPKLLFEAVVRPPTSPEVDVLREWIAAGCPPVPDHRPPPEAFTADQRAWWSFQPPRRVPIPGGGNPIDALMPAPAPAASPAALMRRVHLDLTGLVPTADQVRAFEADSAPGAFERLVERLLDSPHYGERWARMWLDLAGYADSEGIIDEDLVRPQAWRYRDATIRAFNSGMPYDRFLREQIAGDELVDRRSLADPSQADIDRLAATGFLRMAPDGTYSPANGSVAERMNVIADEIEILSSAVMGITVGCARCHNHKYDPIPQRDYYRLAAILQTAYDPYDWVKPTERNLDVALSRERAEVDRLNRPIEEEVAKLEKVGTDAAKKSAAEAKKRLKPKPRIRALYDMGGTPSPVFLLKRGEAQLLGEQVEPQVPSILHGVVAKAYEPRPPFDGTSGRRLGLAEWLAQPGHPLTARVMVNRIWAQHFGKGLVHTPANFGRTGAMPGNPKLLDWLAVEFVESGWNIKALHRLILTSKAYRQRRPPRRMDAEQLHDSILRASGRLSASQFGPPVPVETRPGGEVVQQASGDGWRRAIYLLQRRTTPVTMLEVFDLPPMSPNCTERAQSTVAPQALELRNSPVVLEHARYMAARLLDQFPGDRRRQVEEMYLRALSRRPTEAESARVLAAVVGLEPMWEAHLADQRTLAPRSATAAWHALADAAHALLSSAEFAYVD
jgi:mono/diheme cytochrome c family protein